MPLYEFRCQSCGQLQEFLLRLGEGPGDRTCGGCGSAQLVKQLSTFAAASGSAAPAAPCGASGGCGSGFS